MTKTEFICPLCQQSNRCGINEEGTCWCMSKVIPKTLIKEVPTDQINKYCICAGCIDRFNNLAQRVF